MAITNVDPATLGSFNATNVVLQHGDTVDVDIWNRTVQNAATSYCMFRSAIASSRGGSFETDQYSCIPPTPSGVYLSSGLAEKAALRYTVVWQTVLGSDPNGTVYLLGGTNLSALGTLDARGLGASAGTYSQTIATPIDMPGFVTSGGSTWAPPYWLVVRTVNPPATQMLLSTVNVRFSRYPVIT